MTDAAVRTLPDIFDRSLRVTPRDPALTHWTPAQERHFSSSSLERQVARLAAGLIELGVKPGDRVLLISENRPEWAFIDWATLFSGGILVPVYTSLTVSQLRYILDNSGARIAIASTQRLLDKLAEASRGLETVETIVSIDKGATATSSTPLETVARRGEDILEVTPDAWREPAGRLKEEDLATIIYTSGTTGPPKGVMLTHGNLVSNVTTLCGELDFNPEDVALSFLPLCHVTQRLADYCYFHRGARIVYVGLEDLPASLRAVRPTTFPGVPRVYEKIRDAILARGTAASPLRRKVFGWALEVGLEMARGRIKGSSAGAWLSLRHALADRLVLSRVREGLGGRVRYGVCGGAPLNPEVTEFFLGVGIPILEGYGLTESTVLTINRMETLTPGSVGPPLPSVEIRIGQAEEGDGEILARGPGIALGYYRDETRTKETFRDGWLATGDLGRFDERGNLLITGRKKELLVTSGGKKISPALMEQRIASHGLISQIILVGEGRKFVSALVVPDRARLLAYCRDRGMASHDAGSFERLLSDPEVYGLYAAIIEKSTRDFARFEKIKKFALLPDEFTVDGGELTPTMKIKRRAVEEKYRVLIESLYQES